MPVFGHASDLRVETPAQLLDGPQLESHVRELYSVPAAHFVAVHPDQADQVEMSVLWSPRVHTVEPYWYRTSPCSALLLLYRHTLSAVASVPVPQAVLHFPAAGERPRQVAQ